MTISRERQLEVANTILAQIRAGAVTGCRNGAHAMMCWGYDNPVAFELNDNPGVYFKVQGAKRRGKIAVVVTPADTYTILHFNPWAKVKDWVIQEENVYCEDLAEFLDILIEGR